MKSQAELADLATDFDELDEQVLLADVSDGRQATDLGPVHENHLAGIPYDQAPVKDLCDKLQWVIENTAYEMRIDIEVTKAGYAGGCRILDQQTGEELPGAGVKPQLITGTVDGINLTPKRIYVLGSRMADNVIRFMIEKGLTNGAEETGGGRGRSER